MRKCISVFVLPFIFAVSQAHALDISISGRVSATPCTVDVDTESKLVELGQIPAQNINTPQAATHWKNFNLLLINCSPTLSTAGVEFSGVPDNGDITAYRNDGTAKNTALQLTNSDHSVVYGSGKMMQVSIDPATHKAIFPLSARIISPQRTATGGSFSAAVNVTFIYQ